MAEKTPRPPAPTKAPRPAETNGEARDPSRSRRGPDRPGAHAKPWLDELDGLRTNTEGRIGNEETRRDKLVGGAEGLHAEGQLEWGQDYPGYGGTGCVSLPFIAAAKSGLISMAQAARLSQDPRNQDDIEPILRDIFGFVGWSKTPDSRKWGHPSCKPKKGDLAVFASKKNDADFSHVALIASPAGDIYSLEPNATGAPAALRKSHVNVYLSEQKAGMTSDPVQPMTAREADEALGCIVCPFPF